MAAMSKAETTAKLDPGTYAMECYIKEKGVFHTTLGMIRPLEVLEASTSLSEPAADMMISLYNEEMKFEGSVKKGTNSIGVSFEEHPEFELGNDIHLIRLEDDTNIESVINWLNWMNIEGLETPAPATFLGGTQEMPVGHRAYFRVDLPPGKYAWIAESAAYRGLVHEFKVED